MKKESWYRDMIAEQKESGLTIIDFCFNHSIAPSTFHYWKKKIRKTSDDRKDFIPLLVKSSGMERPKGSVCSEISQVNEALLEVVYPNGIILRLKQDLDLDQLRTLIHLYD